VAIGISLWFDTALEARVREIWSDLAAQDISALLHDGPYRPHLTLGVWERLDVGACVLALREAAPAWPAFPIKLASVGAFPGDEGASFLQPAMSASLLRMHRQVHELASTFATHPFPYYLPDAWTPHCTMAWRVPRPRVLQAVDLLLSCGLPFEGRVVAVGVIDTPTEVELHRIELPG